jgi:hypothetical protein
MKEKEELGVKAGPVTWPKSKELTGEKGGLKCCHSMVALVMQMYVEITSL